MTPSASAGGFPGSGDDDPRFEAVARCYLCGSPGILRYSGLTDRLFDAPGTAALLECASCGLLWLSPRLRPAFVAEAYGDYYTHREGSGPVRMARMRRGVRDLVAEGTIGARGGAKRHRLAARLLAALPSLVERVEPVLLELRGAPPGAVLDVGCGDGRVLGLLSGHGWRAEGVEPDPAAAERARRGHGLTVHESLDALASRRDGFDLVLARHVVEHVHDPAAFLADCYRLVRRGGRLIVLTPNAASLGHRIFGASWFHLDPPRHLYVFSVRTLRAVACKAGLGAPRFRTLARAGRETWQVSRCIARRGRASAKSVRLRDKLAGLAFAGLERAVGVVRREAGEEIMMVVRA